MRINKLLTSYNHDKGDVSRIKYIVIHYVGALGTARGNCEWYAEGNKNASAHYFVGHDGVIWQSVEDKNIAWHCGSSNGYNHPECRNANSIGIEMCVRKKSTKTLWASDKDWYFEDETVEATIELTKYLMKKYGIPEKNVIRHYDVTGKICPNPYVYNYTNHTWEDFKKALTDEQPKVKKLSGLLKVIYKGEDGLNVRNSPEMGNNIREVVYGGTYTVTGISADGDWYQLKSGGYITAGKRYVEFTEGTLYKVIDCHYLNVRETPNGKMIGSVKRDQIVLRIGEGKDSDGDVWFKIKADNVTGFVWTPYVEKV